MAVEGVLQQSLKQPDPKRSEGHAQKLSLPPALTQVFQGGCTFGACPKGGKDWYLRLAGK